MLFCLIAGELTSSYKETYCIYADGMASQYKSLGAKLSAASWKNKYDTN